MAKNNIDPSVKIRYEAKQKIAEARALRGPKDNKLALLVSAAAVVLALSGQAIYFNFGPGYEAPTSETAASDSASLEQDSTATGPDESLAENRNWAGTLNLNEDLVEFTLFGDLAPKATANFISLSQQGFFEGTSCHRLVTEGIFVLQCGDPDGTGRGGPDYRFGPIENDPADDIYPAGTIAMARTSNDGQSMGSQFFLVFEDSQIPSDIVGGYSIFGQIDNGLETVANIASKGTEDGSSDGRPATEAVLTNITLD